MGRVVVPVVVENVEDRERAERGEIAAEAVRRITVEALVDSGATFLCMPESMIRQLGLRLDRMRETRTVTGPLTQGVYRGARIEVQQRACTDEIMALPEGRQVLLGQIPLESSISGSTSPTIAWSAILSTAGSGWPRRTDRAT